MTSRRSRKIGFSQDRSPAMSYDDYRRHVNSIRFDHAQRSTRAHGVTLLPVNRKISLGMPYASERQFFFKTALNGPYTPLVPVRFLTINGDGMLFEFGRFDRPTHIQRQCSDLLEYLCSNIRVTAVNPRSRLVELSDEKTGQTRTMAMTQPVFVPTDPNHPNKTVCLLTAPQVAPSQPSPPSPIDPELEDLV